MRRHSRRCPLLWTSVCSHATRLASSHSTPGGKIAIELIETVPLKFCSSVQPVLTSPRRAYQFINGVTVIPCNATEMAIAASTVFATASVLDCVSPC